jgi:hypothetical protein
MYGSGSVGISNSNLQFRKKKLTPFVEKWALLSFFGERGVTNNSAGETTTQHQQDPQQNISRSQRQQ